MKKDLDLQQLGLYAIFATAAVLLYLGLSDSGSSSPAKKISARDQRVQETVNKHLEQTAEQLEMQRRRMQIENSKIALGYNQSEPIPAFVAPREGAELAHDERAERVARDLGLDEDRTLSNDPMSLIQRQIFEEQRLRQMGDSAKKAYAKQFVENARRGGYEVKLSDDYRVISVKPIRQPSGH